MGNYYIRTKLTMLSAAMYTLSLSSISFCKSGINWQKYKQKKKNTRLTSMRIKGTFRFLFKIIR